LVHVRYADALLAAGKEEVGPLFPSSGVWTSECELSLTCIDCRGGL
jgi:hypothetical protein